MEEGRNKSVLIKEEGTEEDRDPQGEMTTREERAGAPAGARSPAPEELPRGSLTAVEGSGSRPSSLEPPGGGRDTGREGGPVDPALAALASSVWSAAVAGTPRARSNRHGDRGRSLADLRGGATPAGFSAMGTAWLPPSDARRAEVPGPSGSWPWEGGENARFLCRFCGKGFRFAAKLRVHHRVHTGEKPYRCAHCGRGFSQSCSLTRHLNVHTGYKPFCCGLCGKAYSNKRSLKKHQTAHRAQRVGN